MVEFQWSEAGTASIARLNSTGELRLKPFSFSSCGNPLQPSA
jgi:hypothetical protein